MITGFRPRSRRRAVRRLQALRRALLAPRRRSRRKRSSAALSPDLFGGTDLVVVDVETTGLFEHEASITEIGAVRLGAGRPMTEFCTLVNPGVPIPTDITALTGITDAMVRDAPTIAEVLPRFLEFADGSVIAAHNAPFDVGFLTAAAHASGITWPPRAVIDTAVLARMVLGPGEVPDHKLSTLARHFAARTGPCHRALADAKATLEVLTALLGRAATMAPQPGRGLPGSRRRLWSRRSF